MESTNISSEQTITQPQIPTGNKKRNILVFVVVLLSVGVAALFLLRHNASPASIGSELLQRVMDKALSPTPMPFEELTIPYLRQKTYKSELGEREMAYDASTYTAYITSFKSDGYQINGLLTIPTGDAPSNGWPAIVFVHGYIPPAQYQTTGESYSSYVDYLASNGFVVFKIDLRGHGESEGEAGGGYYGSDYVIDTLNAYAALQAADFVNDQAIGLWGHSMAGNVAMRSMAVKPDIPAVVVWAGAVYSYTDQPKYGINDASFSPNQFNSQRLSRRRELFEKHGSPSADSPFWQQVAPTSYLNDLKGAIEIHHAVDDAVVNIGYSRDLIELLDKTSVQHELFEYQSGGHNIDGGSFSQAMERTSEFFTEHLRD